MEETHPSITNFFAQHPTQMTPQQLTQKRINNPTFPPLLNDTLLKVCRHEKVSQAPIWIMRQAGKFNFQFSKNRSILSRISTSAKRTLFFRCLRKPLPGLSSHFTADLEVRIGREHHF